jgi:hypothetical protein
MCLVCLLFATLQVVPLSAPVAVTEDVESWLTNLAGEMADTLAKLLVDCVRGGESDVRKYPSQVGTIVTRSWSHT